MTPTDSRRPATTLALLAGFLVAGCVSPPSPITDAERDAIIETMTRVSSNVLGQYDRAGCLAAIERNFSGREPALTWSIAGQGTASVANLRTKEDLESSCTDTPRPRARMDIEEVDAHVLSRDHAYIVMTVVGTSEDEPVEGPRLQTRFVMTNIFERVGEDWKIARHHAAVITESQ